MKVSELIAELRNIEGDPEVILASDAEGNDYSVLYAVEAGFWDGEYPIHPDDIEDDDDYEPVVALYRV